MRDHPLRPTCGTLEELSLLQKVVRGLGSENIDFRLRQSDAIGDRSFTPWLGMSIDAFSHLKRVFVIGSLQYLIYMMVIIFQLIHILQVLVLHMKKFHHILLQTLLLVKRLKFL